MNIPVFVSCSDAHVSLWGTGAGGTCGAEARLSGQSSGRQVTLHHRADEVLGQCVPQTGWTCPRGNNGVGAALRCPTHKERGPILSLSSSLGLQT